jgi:hypothetical protein
VRTTIRGGFSLSRSRPGDRRALSLERSCQRREGLATKWTDRQTDGPAATWWTDGRMDRPESVHSTHVIAPFRPVAERKQQDRRAPRRVLEVGAAAQAIHDVADLSRRGNRCDGPTSVAARPPSTRRMTCKQERRATSSPPGETCARHPLMPRRSSLVLRSPHAAQREPPALPWRTSHTAPSTAARPEPTCSSRYCTPDDSVTSSPGCSYCRRWSFSSWASPGGVQKTTDRQMG